MYKDWCNCDIDSIFSRGIDFRVCVSLFGFVVGSFAVGCFNDLGYNLSNTLSVFGRGWVTRLLGLEGDSSMTISSVFSW